jgi:hypothetical protein
MKIHTYVGNIKSSIKIFWAAHTLFAAIFLLQGKQKGFSLQSLPQYIDN